MVGSNRASRDLSFELQILSAGTDEECCRVPDPVRSGLPPQFPAGRKLFCTNMVSRSVTEIVGSPSSSCASGVLARKSKQQTALPADPTKLSSPSSLVSFCSRSRWISAACPGVPWSLPSAAGPILTTNEPRSVSSFTADDPNTLELGSRRRFSAMKGPPRRAIRLRGAGDLLTRCEAQLCYFRR
jgi:hypothetical protein